MDKITYASDTAAAVPGANLSVARYGLAASSARANALPITEPPVTTPSPSSSLVSFPSPNNGYLSGGGPSYKTSVIKLSFATDTDSTTPSSDMTNSRLDHAAIGNFTHGYFAGGKDAYDELSITDKITYSNDTTFRAPGADLSLARSDVAGTGNSDAGYITGGYVYPSSTYSRVDKLTYSSDTLAYVPGTNLPARRVEHTAMGNQTHGYIGAGYDPSTSYKSTIDKITYSSDTTASLPNSNLSEGRQMLSSVGNATRGYFAGGVASSSTGFRSIVDRIEFSTDTIQRIPGADLTTPYRRSSAGTGNSTHGYFSCGGSQFGDQNRSVDKLDYSTETCGPRFNISTQLTGHAATGGRKNGLTPSFSAPVSNNL